jgi:hypothetical protein
MLKGHLLTSRIFSTAAFNFCRLVLTLHLHMAQKAHHFVLQTLKE